MSTFKKNQQVNLTRRNGQPFAGKIVEILPTPRGDFYVVRADDKSEYRARAAQLTSA